jgi:predicted nucleic acid-binding protein
MITAVDTCILIDVFQGVGEFAVPSAEALSRARQDGPLVICELVYAELAAFAEEQAVLDGLLAELEIQVVELGRDAAFAAGLMFAKYRRSGGQRRAIVADFIIAAHAQYHAQRLLTRDRGFAREWFGEMEVVEPGG